MKNVGGNVWKVACLFTSCGEYERILKELFGDDLLVEFGMEGIWVGYDDSDLWVDEERIHSKLAEYFGVRKVTSVHMDDDVMDVGVWIAYED